MPIIAVCPYCRKGRVRAPDRAVGMSYPCPQCHSHFTLSPSGEADVAAARSSRPVPHPAPRVPATPAETAPHTAATFEMERGSDGEGERGSEAKGPGTDFFSPPLPLSPPPALPPAQPTDPGLPWALAAITLAGVGLAASQLPYGRLLTAGLGGVGLLVALLGVLAAERKKLLPAAACGMGGLAVLLAVAFPGLLGQTGWLPPRVEDTSRVVLSVGHEGGDRAPAEWVDGSRASWQQDDVKVSVIHAKTKLEPVELVGPNGQKKVTKDRFLQIGLRVVNAGVARSFEFQGWSASSPAGTAPRLTDSAGKSLSVKRFDPGWEPAAAGPDHKALFPGKQAEYVLVFDPPGKGAEYVRLELPGAAFGGENPVRLQIPASFIVAR